MSGTPGDVPDAVRVRFCPSPTGNPHVGLMRTALFNHAWARHTGGTFVFRIEDTDAARDTEQSYRDLLDVLHWFSLDWDEGPEVGGPHGPYRQSQRSHLYADAAARLRTEGEAYPCFCTPEEVAARATAAGRPPGYDNHCRTLTSAGRAAFEAEGRPAVLRLRVPDRTLAWTDLVRGDVAFAPEHVADYVLVRANGRPLYTLTNPLDDALMRITDVLRGEDLLASTPRQIALYEALGRVGLTDGTVPRFGHLPYVMGEGNRKLSKRDPQSAVAAYRSRGFLPEGLSNYLALLGWALGPDRDIFDRAEMDTAFDIADVNANPARFDLRKCEAVNAAWVRRLDPDDLASRLVPVLTAAGLLPDPPDAAGLALVAALTPLLQERMTVLTDAVEQVRFLFSGADHVVDPAAAATHLVPAQEPLLEASRAALADLPEWTADAVQAALRGVADTLGQKPRKAFPVLYVAVTGRATSIPLFDGIALLGREHTLARLSAAVADLRADRT